MCLSHHVVTGMLHCACMITRQPNGFCKQLCSSKLWLLCQGMHATQCQCEDKVQFTVDYKHTLTHTIMKDTGAGASSCKRALRNKQCRLSKGSWRRCCARYDRRVERLYACSAVEGPMLGCMQRARSDCNTPSVTALFFSFSWLAELFIAYMQSLHSINFRYNLSSCKPVDSS